MEHLNSQIDDANSYPVWSPRIWLGFRPSIYYQIVSENRFQVHPSRLPMLLLNGSLSFANSLLVLIQKVARNRAIHATEFEKHPVFIIGHWRSGTTLTHELMSLDDNFAYPDNYDAFSPEHFLVSGIFRSLMKLLIPQQRPMDDMIVEIDSPQEDDFAIMAMGAPTHYRRIAFPMNQDQYCRLLDFENLNDREQAKLESSLRYFLQALTLRDRKQLILKSPPHTGRIKLLLKLFPNARFVHICRHPYRIVPSTMRLWRLTDDLQAFQKPNYTDDALLNHIERSKNELYRAYRRDRDLLAENQLVEISFEQLIANPGQTIAMIYDKLDLGPSGETVAATKEYFEKRKDHRKNTYQIDPIRERIDSEWADYMDMFGYSSQSISQQETNVA